MSFGMSSLIQLTDASASRHVHTKVPPDYRRLLAKSNMDWRPVLAQTKKHLAKDEAERLLSEIAIVSPQWRDIALLSLHTGMRAGEIFALRWEHLDIDNGVIQITDPKGGPAQTAHMTETIKELLRHSSLAMTERYGHLIPDHKRQAINVIEAKMNRPSEPGRETPV